MNEFHMPTQKALNQLVRDLKLDGLQAHELRLVLRHVDEDLKAHRKRLEGSKPRRELVRRLRRVAKLVDDLEFELGRWWNTIDDLLPSDAQEEMGLLMSFSAMESALNAEIRLPELRSEIESLSSENPDF